jgi:putative hydrolase of the HAD superfamily
LLKRILLLDYDHTMYASTLPTLKAVDARITLYVQTFLGLSAADADATRVRLYSRHGTTLRGLEQEHGVDRHHYCDFVHAIDQHHLPPPDPALLAWLGRVPHPLYLFTNARRDWVERGLHAMGLSDILPEDARTERVATESPAVTAALPSLAGNPRLHGIFDIDFLDWEGKPHAPAYAKVDAHLRARHGDDLHITFADDRTDNLATARARGWTTIWIQPHDAAAIPSGYEFDRAVSSLTRLDPERLI